MNDLFYEIIMQSSILITGLDKQNLLYNLFLTIFGLFELPELYVMDLAGQSSKFSRFSPAIYAPDAILDTLNSIHADMCARIDGTATDTTKPIYMYIHNFDSIINQFSGKEKKSVQYIISDIVNRGQAANLHIIITADKCTNPLFSDFACKVYSGKADRKTAQKYFGAIANELTNFDCSDSGQAMSIIDGTIYKFNVPEIPETDIDSIMQDLTGSADNAPVCPVNAPECRATAPAELPQNSKKTAVDTGNIIMSFLIFVIGLFTGAFDRMQDFKRHIVKNAAGCAICVICSIVQIAICPVIVALKLTSSISSVFGGFGTVCMLYMSVCTVIGLMA